ncbi:MAG TPA: hypothetical protein VLC29_02310, partial [Rhizomicrobium sp.]|nr:hypothetical protein [Rhizomicrobium sp.]
DRPSRQGLRSQANRVWPENHLASDFWKNRTKNPGNPRLFACPSPVPLPTAESKKAEKIAGFAPVLFKNIKLFCETQTRAARDATLTISILQILIACAIR